MKTIAPSGDRILLRIEDEEKTKGGIVIPDNAKGNDKFRAARVLAVGPGRLTDEGRRIRPDHQVGDAVLVDAYGCLKVTLDGRELYLARAGDVLGRIEEVPDRGREEEGR